MGEVKKALTKKYKLPFDISESTLSMLLGGIVVILVGLIAFNFFRTQREQNENIQEPEVSISEVPGGQVGGAKKAVALPASHTVVAGETLWSIAEDYYGSGFNKSDIIAVNKLSNPNIIEVGQKLTIPKVGIQEKTVVNSILEPTITDSKIQGDKYTIMAGDNLWDIAIRAYGDGYKWTEIAKANNLTNPDIIHINNVLSIPRK